MANFMSKFQNFCYHGNKGRSWLNLNDTVKLHDLENPLSGAKVHLVWNLFSGLCYKFCQG